MSSKSPPLIYNVFCFLTFLHFCFSSLFVLKSPLSYRFVAVVWWSPLHPGRPCMCRIESGLDPPELHCIWVWAASAALNLLFFSVLLP